MRNLHPSIRAFQGIQICMATTLKFGNLRDFEMPARLWLRTEQTGRAGLSPSVQIDILVTAPGLMGCELDVSFYRGRVVEIQLEELVLHIPNHQLRSIKVPCQERLAIFRYGNRFRS